MTDHYKHKDMYLENIFLACTKHQLKNFVRSWIFIILIDADRTILI